MDFEEVLPRRALRNGRWDKILKAKMVALSEADNYNDAKDEWVVTGNTWYIPFSDDAMETLPAEHNTHPHACLCGHNIVWHFEIENTVTNVLEIVGSDHINSYMVLRHLVEEKGWKEENITEEMIDEWITEQVKSLKAAWWWDLHGEQFTEWFEEVRELDLRFNVRVKNRRYNYHTSHYENTTVIRKRSEGKMNQYGYKMASIVWRWNHPDNKHRQIDTRGYPNERLWADLQLFYLTQQKYRDMITEEQERIRQAAEDKKIQDEKRAELWRIQRIARDEQKRQNELMRIEQDKKSAESAGDVDQKRIECLIAERLRVDETNEVFERMCEFYDIKPFSENMGETNYDRVFLTDMVRLLSAGKELSPKQLKLLVKKTCEKPRPITSKQAWYIGILSNNEYIIPANTTSIQASKIITQLKEGAE